MFPTRKRAPFEKEPFPNAYFFVPKEIVHISDCRFPIVHYQSRPVHILERRRSCRAFRLNTPNDILKFDAIASRLAITMENCLTRLLTNPCVFRLSNCQLKQALVPQDNPGDKGITLHTAPLPWILRSQCIRLTCTGTLILTPFFSRTL